VNHLARKATATRAADVCDTVRTSGSADRWRRRSWFAWANLRFLASGGFVLPFGHRLSRGHSVAEGFFGICVASAPDAECDSYVIDRLHELRIRHVRLDYTYAAPRGYTERFLDRLLSDGFDVCLHLVQPREQAQRMHTQEVQAAWTEFVAATVDRYGPRLGLVEIGSTCNRRRWSGYCLETFLAAWRIAHRVAAARGVPVAAPNVTDFEPVYNIGMLGIAEKEGMLPAVHTDNLFAERATEPEAYDHKILGRTLAPLLKYNVVKKAALLARISRRYGIRKLMCGHVAWSERRIRRVLSDPWQKQADYLQRYLCLLAASSAFDRVYWGPMIGQREGIIDDGTHEYPELPHVTLYGRARGDVPDYRPRPAFYALQTVIRMLSGTRFVRDHSSSQHLRILEFTNQGSCLHVIWTSNGHGFDPASWYDCQTLARAQATTRDGRTAEEFPWIVGESPVFLRWDAPSSSFRSSRPRIMERHRFHAAQGSITRRFSDEQWNGVMAVRPDRDPDALVGALHPRQLEQAPDKAVLRDGRNTVWSCRLTMADGRTVVVKRSQVRSWYRRLLDRYKPSRPLRSWNGACELLRRGISTPGPLAYFEAARRPEINTGYYVCEAFASDGSVRKAFHAFARGETEYGGVPKHDFYRELAGFIRNMHQRGCFFRDLSSGNILVRNLDDGSPRFSLIDTTRAVFFRRAISLSRQLSDLKRVCHRLTWPERRAFLGHYFGGKAATHTIRIGLAFGLYDAKHWFKQRVNCRARRLQCS